MSFAVLRSCSVVVGVVELGQKSRKGPIKTFHDLEAWQKARELVDGVYQITAEGRLGRDFILKDQMRRSALSAMANIAEGFERDGNREFLHFLSMAKASCGELRSHLFVGLDRGCLTREQFNTLTEDASRVARIIGGLMRYLRQSEWKGQKFS